MAARAARGARLRVSAKTITPRPAIAMPSPVSPNVGSVNEARNTPTAITSIAARWSSAHAITPL
jgi:hypothetical protein